jgi:hypothetical protein
LDLAACAPGHPASPEALLSDTPAPVATATLTGTPAPTPTKTPVPPTPAPNPPVIQTFSVQPREIEVGGCVQISWRVAGDVNLIEILRDGVIVVDNAPRESSGQDCIDQSGTVNYQIEASNSAGGQDSDTRSVVVSDAAPQNPLANTNWVLSSMYGNQVPIPDTSITAFFDASGGVAGQL